MTVPLLKDFQSIKSALEMMKDNLKKIQRIYIIGKRILRGVAF